MKEVKQTAESNRMKGYLVHLGSNHNDEKTKAAYERFKEPPYYLKYKNKQQIRENYILFYEREDLYGSSLFIFVSDKFH